MTICWLCLSVWLVSYTHLDVYKRQPYSVNYGDSCTETRGFTSYHGQEEINIWTLSDLHRTPTNDIMNYVNKAVSHLKGGSPDLIMLLGDICNDMQSKDYAEIGIFDTAAQLSGGTVPVSYTHLKRCRNPQDMSAAAKYLRQSRGKCQKTARFQKQV